MLDEAVSCEINPWLQVGGSYSERESKLCEEMRGVISVSSALLGCVPDPHRHLHPRLLKHQNL